MYVRDYTFLILWWVNKKNRNELCEIYYKLIVVNQSGPMYGFTAGKKLKKKIYLASPTRLDSSFSAKPISDYSTST
jgi:hypothetical protein